MENLGIINKSLSPQNKNNVFSLLDKTSKERWPCYKVRSNVVFANE